MMKYKIINKEIIISHYTYQFFALIFIALASIIFLVIYLHITKGESLFNPFTVLAMIFVFPSLIVSLMWKRYVVSGKEKTLLYELLIFKKIIKSKKIDLKKYEGIAWGKNGMTGSNTMSSLNFIHKIKSYNIYGLIIEQWHENAEIKAKEFSEFLDMKYLGEINNTSIEKTYV